MTTHTKRIWPGMVLGGFAALFAGLVLAGCDRNASSPTAPRANNPTGFFRRIGLTDLQSRLTSGPGRVDVRLVPGTLVARQVQLRGLDNMSRPEEIRAQVTAISGGPDQGALTLDIGGVQ